MNRYFNADSERVQHAFHTVSPCYAHYMRVDALCNGTDALWKHRATESLHHLVSVFHEVQFTRSSIIFGQEIYRPEISQDSGGLSEDFLSLVIKRGTFMAFMGCFTLQRKEVRLFYSLSLSQLAWQTYRSPRYKGRMLNWPHLYRSVRSPS